MAYLHGVSLQILLSYINDGNVEEAEVGQRILTALKQVSPASSLLIHMTGLSIRGTSLCEVVTVRDLSTQHLAPRWLLHNLAGLYWRAVGNLYHGIECLRRSIHLVPADYVDVPLVNMANILYKCHRLDAALNMTRQALIFCDFEVGSLSAAFNLCTLPISCTEVISHLPANHSLDACQPAGRQGERVGRDPPLRACPRTEPRLQARPRHAQKPQVSL